MATEKIIPSDDYRVKVATVVDMADKWFRQADGGELDKYDEIELLDACKSVLKFHGLLVVDPAKCMVLERMEGVPENSDEFYLLMWKTGNSTASRIIRGRMFDDEIKAAKQYGYLCCAFGPISLPTESR